MRAIACKQLTSGADAQPSALIYTLGGHHARVVDDGGRRLLLVGGGDSDHVSQGHTTFSLHLPVIKPG